MAEKDFIVIKPRYKVAMIVYEGFTMLDLIGPAEVFTGYPDTFDMHVVGNCETVAAVGGAFKFRTSMSLEQAILEPEPFDMFVLPGGTEGTNLVAQDKKYLELIKAFSEKVTTVFSICTGSIILAASGILDGRSATTNKFIYHDFTPNFPNVQWKLHARWVHDGKFITSSGITAGMDAAFYILSKVKSKKHADSLAQLLEYNVTWNPDNDPFARELSEPRLEFPIKD